MRRLPVFFLLDVSESMVGDHLGRLEEGLGRAVKELRSDPYALESVYVSVIAFAGKAKVIVPLVELTAFYPPQLPAGGGTSLGKALTLLMDELDRTVVTTTAERKGDWRPIVFLITDGKPTDDPTAAVQRWCNRYQKHASMVAVSVGHNADFTVLNRLTEHVLVLDKSGEGDFGRALAWVTDTIRSQSRSVSETSSDALSLGDAPAALKKIDELLKKGSGPSADERYAIFTGQCQKTRAPYLVKYERRAATINVGPASVDGTTLHLLGTYCVKPSYFEMSDDVASLETANPAQMDRIPSCPQCSSAYALASCPSCSGVFCLDEPGEQKCPWCGITADFQMATEPDQVADLFRSRG